MKTDPLTDDDVSSAARGAVLRAEGLGVPREDRRPEVSDLRWTPPQSAGGPVFVAHYGPEGRRRPRIGIGPTSNQ